MHVRSFIFPFIPRNLSSVSSVSCVSGIVLSPEQQDQIFDVKLSLAISFQIVSFYHQTFQVLSFIYDSFLCFYYSKDLVLLLFASQKDLDSFIITLFRNMNYVQYLGLGWCLYSLIFSSLIFLSYISKMFLGSLM